MRTVVLVCVISCAASEADDVATIVDDGAVGGAPWHVDRLGPGVIASKIGGPFGLEVGFNMRRLGAGTNWSLATPDVFDAALAQLHPHVLRFPGGTIGQYYDWDGSLTPGGAGSVFQTGTACPKKQITATQSTPTRWRPVTQIWRDEDSAHQFDNSPADTLDTLDATLGSLAQNHVTTRADFMLNALTSTSTDQLAMLHAAAAKPNITIDRVEIGNEFYYSGESNAQGDNVFANAFPSARDYADVAKVWADDIATDFPSSHVAVVANERAIANSSCEDALRHTGDRRGDCWNHDLLSGLGDNPPQSVHALVIHPYVWHKSDKAENNNGRCRYNGAYHDMYDNADSLIGAGMEMASALLQGIDVDDPSSHVLDQSLHGWQRPIWVTEFGYLNYNFHCNTDDKACNDARTERVNSVDWTHLWAGGIATLGYAMRLMADGRITVLLHHNVTDAMWAPSSGKHGLTARGIALSELDLALADGKPIDHDDIWRLGFAATSQYNVTGACGFSATKPVTYDALIGRWFTHAGAVAGSSALIVNLGNAATDVDVRNYYIHAKGEVLSAQVKDEPSDEAPVTRTAIELDATHSTIHLPPRSIARFHDVSN